MTDIPADIWDAARAVRQRVIWESNSSVEIVARAIMAERERCAKIAIAEASWIVIGDRKKTIGGEIAAKIRGDT